MNRHIALIPLAVMVCAVFPAAARADSDGHGEGHGKNVKREKHEDGRDGGRYDDRRDGRAEVIVIDPRDRTVIERYVQRDYVRGCPPGLAKKHNGCLPPGQARKYRIGERLPPDVVYSPVPRDLLAALGPVPAGYEYVRVDKDVLLIGEATKKVIDAVTLLSSVGN